jgi:hypothetical protein
MTLHDRLIFDSLTRYFICAPSAIRTRDLLLRRHSPDVARCGWAWPDVPFTCTDNRWSWPGVARYLPALAPHLAPRHLISAANVRTIERSIEPSQRVAGEPLEPGGRVR